ncbi:hypothetical protein HMF3257_04020 [Spirosoma telluris]|uniref:Ig-like domain-containing protein n=1 Tax=Spirosoma telluris TaxID=2183553 RepID=A0A327NME6_9BACT|nr:hypothetical protein HMF3257_04020 [Spirosoma telluris]
MTATAGAGCIQVQTVSSPASCTVSCTPPKLSVGQPICNSNGTYSVSYTLDGPGSVSAVGGIIVGNTVTNIAIGTDVIISASINGSCVVSHKVTSILDCSTPCINPGITMSGPVCVAGTTTYLVNFTVTPGTTVLANRGQVNLTAGVVTGIPANQPVSLTIVVLPVADLGIGACADKVIVIPAPACGVVCQPLGLNTGVALTTCGQTNGAAAVVVNPGSGTAPFSYQWTTANGTVVSSNSVVTGLAPGRYTITVTDSKGCQGTNSVNISSSNGPTLTASVTSTGCGLNNGSASVQVSGGSATYTYQWINALGTVIGSSSTVSGLSAGVYSALVTDASGCSSMTTVTIGTSNPVQVLTQAQSAACGQSTGSASATASGGNGSYSYQWRNAAGVVVATTASLNNAPSGSYTVVVTDTGGCSGSATANISNTTGPQVTGTVTNVLCSGSTSGSVVLTVTGGTPPISYQWSNGSTSQNLSGVGAGVYTVTVRDANGCQSVQSFTITQPAEIVATLRPTNATCSTPGSISLVSVTGGNAPYTYSWSPGGSTATSLSGLSGGTYTLSVSDANGCQAIAIATLLTPTNCQTACSLPGVNVGITLATCGQANGIAVVHINPGSGVAPSPTSGPMRVVV